MKNPQNLVNRVEYSVLMFRPRLDCVSSRKFIVETRLTQQFITGNGSRFVRRKMRNERVGVGHCLPPTVDVWDRRCLQNPSTSSFIDTDSPSIRSVGMK